ncbi:MAG: DeoR/GlpR family DNA-binding transcription regulator [Clostridiales bacterium]|jgi:DeoR/GlpR family transcriptional regulator of sugar metabolism|nr:DeoR/GlpR family DNA-binding transcription regulator [Clostridiales bacterium]
MYQIRQAKIRDYIAEKEIVSIKELRALCPEVTFMTLHRDLDALQREGHVIKLRGGARAVRHTVDPSFLSRERENVGGKNQIAAKSLSLIQPGGSVFFDAGTTTLALIRALPDINLTIFTTGANFANDLQRFTSASVYLCCGSLNRSNMALSGHSTLKFLDEINIDLGFIGVSGYSDESGFTCGKESEMHVKKLVIRKARKSIMLMDSAKLTRLMPYTFAAFEDVDYVVSDAEMPENFQKKAREAGVTVL